MPLSCGTEIEFAPVISPKLKGLAPRPSGTVRSTAPSPSGPAFGSMRFAVCDRVQATQILPFTSTAVPRGLSPSGPRSMILRKLPFASSRVSVRPRLPSTHAWPSFEIATERLRPSPATGLGKPGAIAPEGSNLRTWFRSNCVTQIEPSGPMPSPWFSPVLFAPNCVRSMHVSVCVAIA